MGAYQLFVRRWSKGCGSEHCPGACPTAATRVALARGSVPADVVFVGEAPGESEDALGVPFVGPAGHVLDGIVAGSIPPAWRVAFANLVGCIPRDPDGGKATQPGDQAVKSCSRRLAEFIRLCDHGGRLKLVVAVGKEAREYLTPGYRHSVALHRAVPRAEIVHPAWILRQPLVQQTFAVRRSIVTVRNAVNDASKPRAIDPPAGTAPGKGYNYLDDEIPF